VRQAECEAAYVVGVSHRGTAGIGPSACTQG
jgi:hypothetical protein